MKEDGGILLILLIGLGVLFIASQSQRQTQGYIVTPVQPLQATPSYSNHETYEVVRDSRGRLAKLVVIRDAKVT